MPRSTWKGVISFGMVSIPVRLYLATESNGISFRQLCPEHISPIKYRRWCAHGDHEVTYGEVLRGFEVAKDEYVILEDRDLDNLPLPTSKAIEIQEFVPRGDIDPSLYFKSAYYMEPEGAGRKPYFLLKEALQKTGRTAVAKIALRDREHLCAIQPGAHAQPGQEALLLNTLNWPDEIRSTDGIKGLEAADVEINDRELKMAISLIDSLADTFAPDRYHDNYREALQKVVEAKVAGSEAVAAPEDSEPAKVMDLMEALRASVEAAKSQRRGESVETAKGERRAHKQKAS